jgi:hypothetical protein
LQRTADHFPESAAVKMNLVHGVLGHHLIEDIDEHILELQEIAYALDPPLVFRYRKIKSESGRHGTVEPEADAPVAQSFAAYLMRRSERAESLPKNLRTLFAFLEKPKNQESEFPFQELLGRFQRESPESRTVSIGELETITYDDLSPIERVGGIEMVKLKDMARAKNAEIISLRLILEEIDHNDRKHAVGEKSSINVTGWLEEGLRPALAFAVSFGIDDDEAQELAEAQALGVSPLHPARSNLVRLWTLRENGLQQAIEPRPDRKVPSSGMGLYMANFAASTVGWELTVHDVRASGQEGALRGHCVFHLIRQVGVKPLWKG